MGIYRHVWLVRCRPVHLAHWGTYITTPEVSDQKALVRNEITIENYKQLPVEARLVTRFYELGADDVAGKCVAEKNSTVKIHACSYEKAVVEVDIANPKRWDITAPARYLARTQVYVGDELTDTYHTSFGIRTIDFSASDGSVLAFVSLSICDKNGLVMTQNCKAAVHTYSTRSLADYKAQILEEGFDGMMLNINGKEVFVPLVGRFNVSNLLCIYGAALNLGFDELEVLRVLSTLKPVNGRFETIHSDKGWTAIVDYAHTPDAVDNVIQTIREIKCEGAKLITVVGCGGNRDKGKRPMMAQIAKKGSEQLILTSDNPRDEEPADILKDMTDGLTEEELRSTLVIEDRAAAIQTACTLAQRGDVILVAGKGHEDYQIIKGVKYHFDDHEQVRKHL